MANNNKIYYNSNPQRKPNGAWYGGSKGSQKHQWRDYQSDNNYSEQAIRVDKCGNLGLLFTRRYFEELTIPLVEKIDKEKDKDKYITQQKNQSNYYKERNNNLILQAKSFDEPCGIETGKISQIKLVTTYPGLLIGTGIIHSTGHLGETKLGLMFDHTTGLPYLPGSSVKGLLRSMFPSRDLETAQKCVSQAQKEKEKVKRDELLQKAEALKKQADEKRSLIAEWLRDEKFNKEMVDDLELSIFDGIEYEIDEKTGKTNTVHQSQRDIFFDSFPIKTGKHGLLGLDFITPHKNEFQNPKPIQFLRIEPDVVFRFEFSLRDSMKQGVIMCRKDQKEALFLKILTTIGIGAKTNVGYGQLEAIKEMSHA